MIIKRLLLILALCILCSFGALQPASAWSPFGYVCSGSGNGQGGSAVCSTHTSGNPIAGPHGVIAKVANILAVITGVFAVIMIIVGGFKYITSGGEGGKVSSAKDTILHALIGLAIIALARTIIVFVIGKI